MASELEVTTIRGLSSGSDANKIIVPSGHNIYEQHNVIQMGSASTGYGAGARILTNSTSWTTVAIGGTNQELINTTKNGQNVIGINKKHNSSHLMIRFEWPTYMYGTGGSGSGIRFQGYSADSSINNGNAHLIDTLPNGYADYWGMTGYPTDTGISATNAFTWRTDLNSNYKNDWKTYTGVGYFYWEVRLSSTNDQLWMIDYGDANPKYGMITWWELAV